MAKNMFICVECGDELHRVFRAKSEVTGPVCKYCYANVPKPKAVQEASDAIRKSKEVNLESVPAPVEVKVAPKVEIKKTTGKKK